MAENRRLDDELADMTDAIIANLDVKPSEELADLAEVVRGLHDLIESNATPPTAFETRMKQRLDLEWEQRQRRAVRTRVNPAVRLVALAAALVVVMVVVIFLTNNPTDGGLSGFADGSTEFLIAFTAVAAVVGAAILVWRNRR